MLQCTASRCPSVHSIIVIIIFVIISYTIANFRLSITVAAEKVRNSESEENVKVKSDQNLINRYYHSTDHIRISNSRCPSFCECEHVISGDSTKRVEISVFCYEGGLEQTTFSKLLKQIPPEVMILDVRAPPDRPNYLLWDDNLNQLRQLRILRLVNCAIPAISRALKLRALEVLDLRGNRIQHLSISIFSGVPSIKELNLAQNHLSVLPTGAFTYLKNLHILSLAHNNITEISANLLRDLKNLKALHLDGNRVPVGQLNLLFADVPQLERLELNECGLNSGTINNLTFSKFESLHRLGLAGNMLGKLPVGALRHHLHSLVTLDLSDNALIDIAPEVFANTNISRLLLAGNRLGVNPKALQTNSLKTGTTLQELDLSRNSFAHFHPEILGEAKETIEILHLNGNHINGIEAHLTSNMTKLRILHLGHNFIEYLPHKMPDEFAQLVFLNLSGNQLSSLPEYAREQLPELTKLDISENRFISFPVSVMENFLNDLDKVDFHDNPFDCTCYLDELKRHMQERYAYRHELQYEKTCCNTPEEYSGLPIYRLNHIANCALFFGAHYGLSQLSEMAILFLGLIGFSLITTLLILFACSRLDRKRKKKYNDVAQSQSRIALTLSQHLSNSPSSLTEPLTPPPESPISGISAKMPPPPPPILASI